MVLRSASARGCRERYPTEIPELTVKVGANKRKRPRQNQASSGGQKKGPKSKAERQAQLDENVRPVVCASLSLLAAPPLLYMFAHILSLSVCLVLTWCTFGRQALLVRLCDMQMVGRFLQAAPIVEGTSTSIELLVLRHSSTLLLFGYC